MIFTLLFWNNKVTRLLEGELKSCKELEYSNSLMLHCRKFSLPVLLMHHFLMLVVYILILLCALFVLFSFIMRKKTFKKWFYIMSHWSWQMFLVLRELTLFQNIWGPLSSLHISIMNNQQKTSGPLCDLYMTSWIQFSRRWVSVTYGFFVSDTCQVSSIQKLKWERWDSNWRSLDFQLSL